MGEEWILIENDAVRRESIIVVLRQRLKSMSTEPIKLTSLSSCAG